MPDILLTTLNAKYIHAAFGLRYLLANLGPLQSRARVLEFDIHQRPTDIAEALLSQHPKIIGIGVYIWNATPITELIAALKRIRPDIKIVLGGPEVSYELESQPVIEQADHVLTGEADLKFAELCRQLLDGQAVPKIISADLPDFSRIALPYSLYTDDDIAHRILYVEASRGCPFTCEFCLSSLDIPVRQVPLRSFLESLQHLLNRGAKRFKFVDRTFNLNISSSKTILEFLLERYQPGHFYHFEMIPDRLPDALRDIIAKFPPGALQFEVGVQTFNGEVGALIKRRQNNERLEENLRFLRSHTGVHIHADLIVGLPGETLESFAAGFDRLIALEPQEIQVGILKRLRGTPISRHDAEWQMAYNPHPPYEILQNKLLDFSTMQKLRRFARFWDLIGNSGNFVNTCPLIWTLPPPDAGSPEANGARDRLSPFHSFMRFSEWLYVKVGRTDSIALTRLMELVFEFLTAQRGLEPRATAETLLKDYRAGYRHDTPGFLKEHLPASATLQKRPNPRLLPKRQARHAWRP